jgi:predicted aspartyl protease
VDTAATETVITPPTARELGIKVRKVPTGHGKASLESLAAGNARVGKLEVFVFDPPQALSLRLDHGVDYRGLFGYTFLSRFVTTLDYRNSRMRLTPLSRVPGPRAAPAGSHAAAFTVKDRLIHAQGTINGRGPVTFLVDTGSAEVLVYPRTASALGLLVTPRTGPRGPGFARLDSVSLAGAVVKNVPAVVHTPPGERDYRASYHAILGYPFLSHFTVTLNYRDRRLLLTPAPPESTDRLPR